MTPEALEALARELYQSMDWVVEDDAKILKALKLVDREAEIRGMERAADLVTVGAGGFDQSYMECVEQIRAAAQKLKEVGNG